MNNKILLPQLITLLSQTSRLPKKQAEAFIKALFSTVSETVCLHENVKIKGFGTFKVTRVEARKSVNVSTGDTLEIPAHYKLAFSPAKELAERVNRDFSWLEIVEISDNVSNEELNAVDKAPVVQPVKKQVEESSSAPEKEESPESQSVEQIVEVPMQEEIPDVAKHEETGEINEPVVNPEVTVEEETREVSEIDENLPEAPAEVPEMPVAAMEAPVAVVESGTAPSQPLEDTRPLVDDDHKTETEGEELGEKLEEDFGQIEPVEPFGPVDPDDPEPGQPIPEDKFVTRDELLTLLARSGDTTRYATKEDIADAKKAMKGIRRDVSDAENRSRSGFRKAVIISIFGAAALLIGGLFLVYFLLLHKIDEKTSALAERIEIKEGAADPGNDFAQDIHLNGKDMSVLTVEPAVSDSIPAKPVEEKVVDRREKEKELKEAEAEKEDKKAKAEEEEKLKEEKESKRKNKDKDSSVAPTEPSDSKVYDTVTTTRYLTTISRQHYGNYHFWPYIYMENSDILGHPDRIKPGTKVKVPSLTKYGVNPKNEEDIAKAKKLGVEIYAKYK